MQAIISDIHGNLEALQAVVSQLKGIDTICLGDVVCYGADSVECVRLSTHFRRVVASPLDLAMIKHDPNQWSPKLNEMIEKTQLPILNASDRDSLILQLSSYEPEFVENHFRFFHGAPGNIRDWVFPEDIYAPTRLNQLVDSKERVFIGGASHIPGIYYCTDNTWEFVTPETGVPYDLHSHEKTLITVGSVGQPRDGDSRASYAIINGDQIHFQRTEYDISLAQEKIANDPDIENIHADRLSQGR